MKDNSLHDCLGQGLFCFILFFFLPTQTISFAVLEAIGRLIHNIIKNKIISLIKRQKLNDKFLIAEITINKLAN